MSSGDSNPSKTPAEYGVLLMVVKSERPDLGWLQGELEGFIDTEFAFVVHTKKTTGTSLLGVPLTEDILEVIEIDAYDVMDHADRIIDVLKNNICPFVEFDIWTSKGFPHPAARCLTVPKRMAQHKPPQAREPGQHQGGAHGSDEGGERPETIPDAPDGCAIRGAS